MKRIIRFLLSAVLAVTALTAKVNADDKVYVTFVVGEGTILGETGSRTILVDKGKPLSVFFKDPGTEEVSLDNAEKGFKGWSLGPYGNLCYTPEEMKKFCPQEDITLYALYDRKYVVTFDFNGGYWQSKTKYKKEVVRGRRYDFRDIIPDINDPNKAFCGWKLSTGADNFWSYGAYDLSFSGDVTFTAKYAQAVSVYFHAQEGYFKNSAGETFAISLKKAPKGYPCQFNINVSNSNAGRELTEWTVSKTSEKVWNHSLQTHVFNEDADLYAVWVDKIPLESIQISTGVKVCVGDRVEVPVSVAPFANNGYTLYADNPDASVARLTTVEDRLYVEGISEGTFAAQVYALYYDGSLGVNRPFIVTVYADGDPAACTVFGFCWYRGKQYWYEDGVRQGIMGDKKNITDTVYGYERGREIYDPASNAWYWLDAIYDGAKAQSKEVWMPYIYQSDLEAGINKQGKWVRYDNNGAMIKGWYTVSGADIELYPSQAGNTYYYDLITGEMVKGYKTIDGKTRHFDENTGVLIG